MYERFTDGARRIMTLANMEAQRTNVEFLGTEQILLGLIKEGDGVAAKVLLNLGVDLEKARREVEAFAKTSPEMVTVPVLPLTPMARQVIVYAFEEAKNLRHQYVGTEHLILGLVRDPQNTAVQVLAKLGIRPEAIRSEVFDILGHPRDW